MYGHHKLFVIHLWALWGRGLLDGEREENPVSIGWGPDRVLLLSTSLFLPFNLSTFNKVFPYLTAERGLPQKLSQTH